MLSYNYSTFILVLFALTANSLLAQEKSDQPIIPIRFVENYEYLKDSTKVKHFYDPIKYIPLNENGSTYLSLGGELRTFYESIYNRQAQGDGYLLTRVMAHADLNVGKRFRLFVQPASGVDFFREASPRPIDRDKLFLLNAFVDYDLLAQENKSLIVRLGRQELNYGRGHIVSIREGPNVRQYWEGAKLSYQQKGIAIEGFATQYGAINDGVFDNPILDSDETFWGVYAKIDKGIIKGSKLDVYYFGFNQDQTQFFNANGEENRHSIGARIYGKKKSFDYDVEAIGQFGTVGDGDIYAFGIYSDIGYTFGSEKVLQKRIGLKADYFTGDSDADDNNLNSFNPLFPRQGYYQGATALYAANFWDIHPSFTVSYKKQFSFNFNWTWYWRTSTEDGIYINGSGIPLIAPTNSDSRELGNQIDFDFVYNIDKYNTINVDYSHYNAKGFARENETPQEIRDFLNIIFIHRF